MSLVGDAAYCPGPAVGASTSMAVIGAHVLAGELAAASDHTAAWAAYEREMADYVRKARAHAARMVKQVIPGSRAQVWTGAQALRLIGGLPTRLGRALAKRANSTGVHDDVEVKHYPDNMQIRRRQLHGSLLDDARRSRRTGGTAGPVPRRSWRARARSSTIVPMTEAKTVALVTGANKGDRTPPARQAVAALPGRAGPGARGMRAVDTLAAGGLDVELDVTSDESAAAAAKAVAERVDRLDVLVNNAGVGGPSLDPADMDPGTVRRLYEVNVFGQVRITPFVPTVYAEVGASTRGHGVERAGVADLRWRPRRLEYGFLSLAYASSKAALNMIVSQYARALPTFKVNAADPVTPPPT
ncbi:enoyl-ACP reductase-like protein [Nonomuraea polychroma]|uniref:Enoyl-ACP reductase-like protein n=1 Tax=Nonomuraea polychroma TaxID=46176 RepID=A0A438M8B4_9ACTN|nr:SDR family NAD(P)-dependent oxidoreductase [Nonomuraea polychroma]RVX41936.1 enoyl-ACP reductase-like protein [Nonomuraea polychroma]